MAEHLLDELSPVSFDLTPDPPVAPDDDLGRGYQARRETEEETSVIQRAQQARAQEERLPSDIATNAPLEPAIEPQQPAGSISSALDVGRGAMEIPRAGFNALVDAGTELTENLMAIAGEQNVSGALSRVPFDTPFLEQDDLTDEDILGAFKSIRLEDPESASGKMTQGVLQFLVGFLPAMKATKALAAVKGGRILQPMVAGSLADVAVIDEQEGRLSNLLQDFAGLEDPVTTFLATDPDDTAAEGKLKQAIEGMILGGVADGLVESLRWLRTARVARQAEDVTGQTAVRQAEVTARPETSPEQLQAAIGDETAPVFRMTEETDAAAATLLRKEELRLPEGAQFTQAREGSFDVFRVVGPEGKVQAEAFLPPGKSQIADIRVDASERGQGLANQLLNNIEEATGRTLSPSDNLSFDAFRMWERRAPEKVADSFYQYREALLGKELTVDGERLVISDIGNSRISVSPAGNKNLTFPLDDAGVQKLVGEMKALQASTGPIKLKDGLELDIKPSSIPLSPRQEAVQRRFALAVRADPEGMIKRYEELPDTMGGRLINTDEARLLSSEYSASPEARSVLSSAVHEPASALIKVMYARRLAQSPAAGEQALVRFTMGGSGAGKSVAVAKIDAAEEAAEGAIKPQIIFDTNMNKWGSAQKKVQQALKAGKDVDILYVLRDPVDSLVNGALKRAMNPKTGAGRTVTLATMDETHTGAVQVARKMMAFYADDPRFTLQVADNRLGLGNTEIVDNPASVLDDVDYKNLGPELREALDQEFSDGNITETIYRSTLGEDAPGAGLPGVPGAAEGAAQVAGRRAGEAGVPEPAGGPGRPDAGGQPQPQRPGGGPELEAPRTPSDGSPAYPIPPRNDWQFNNDYRERGGQLVWMDPDQFLARAKPLDIDDVSRENIDELKARMEAGEDVDPLSFADETTGAKRPEDGRHRAIAAKELGIKEVPVVVYGDAAQFGAQAAVRAPRPEGIPDEIPDRIGNINLARIGGPEDVRQVIADAARLFEPKLTTPLQTNRQTALLANEIAMDPKRLTEVLTREGAFTAAEVTAIRFMLHSSGRQLKDMAVKAASAGASDLDKFVFRRQMAFHAAMLEQASGAARESGRALQAFKITALGAKEQDRAVREMVQSVDQGLRTDQMAAMLATLDQPQQIATFVRQSQRAKTADVLLEAWINGLLSGPQTHAVNTLSNTVVAFWQIPERALAAQIRKLSGGEGVAVGEATAQAFGLVKGIAEGFRLAGRAMRTGEPSDVFTKIEARRFRSISSEGLGLDEGGVIGRAVDLLGEVVRLPGRALAAEDEFFKAVGYRMELQARAYRQAAQEGLDGDGFASRVQDIINNPPEDLRLALIDTARYQTFTKPLGEGGKSFTTALNKAPALRVIMPFVRTPLNIMKFVGERTPLAPMSKAVRMEIAAGGARRDLALAKIGMGSMMMASFADMASSGLISGNGPSDRRLRSAMRRTGWQPYSIKVGDTWVAYNRLDPVGATIGIAADLANILGQAEKADVDAVVAASVMAVSQNIVSKTYMSGIADVMEVFASVSPEAGAGAAEKWIQRLAGTLVPAGSAQATRIIDPNMRQVRTMVEKIRSRIPGLSDSLPPRLNLWGDPIMYTGGVGPDIASPLWASPVNKDAVVDDEMVRLEMGVSMPSRMLRGIEMEPETYNTFVRLAGSDLKDPGTGLGARDTLKAIISGKHALSAEYEDATDGPDGGKALVIREVVQSFRQAARATILDPDSPDYQEDFAEELGEVRRLEALQLGVSLSP